MAEWISVKDRLPEEKGQYLCLLNICEICEYKVLRFSQTFLGKLMFFVYDGNGCSEVTNVTHWMPLPKPPKGE